MRIPAQVQAMLCALEDAGYAAYLVGGCVRDELLGLMPKDYDIASAALPEQATQALLRAGCRVHPTGVQHGTVTAVLDQMVVEITTFRSDGQYLDHRHPSSVTFVPSLWEDLLRRDFTCNALAYRPKDGLVDLVGGLDDLNARLLRCVGKPEKRFSEDALRILRALRFASTLGFAIEDKTDAAIHACAPLLKDVASERISKELCGCLLGTNAAVLQDYPDVLRACLPGYEDVAPDVYRAQMRGLCGQPQILAIRLCRLAEISAQPEETLTALRLSAAMHKNVLTLLSAREDKTDTLAQVRWAVRRYGSECARYLLLMQKKDTYLLDRIEKEHLCCRIADLDVNGNELGALGLHGAQIGEMLNYLLDEVIEERLHNLKDELLMAAKERMSAHERCDGNDP